MSELEKIQEIVHNNIYNNAYSQDDLDIFSNVMEYALKIRDNADNISLFDEKIISFLVDKDIITDVDGKLLKSYVIVKRIGRFLSNESDELLSHILTKIINKLREVNNSLENKDVKLLYNKIKNGFRELDVKELELLFDLIKDCTYPMTDKQTLIMYVSLKVITFDNEYIVDEHEVDDSEKGMTEKQCVELFRKYGYSFETLSRANQLALENGGNYAKIDQIFTLLRSKNINLRNNGGHNIFRDKAKNIIEILLKSNASCIERIIAFAEKYEILYGNVVDFYKMILTPSKFILNKRVHHSKYHENNNGNDICGSHQDFLENVAFFDQICNRLYHGEVNFFHKLYEKRNGSLLDYPHKRVLEVARIFQSYGLEEKDYFESATTAFLTMHQADVLDLVIELDMLDYLKCNQSLFAISLNDTSFDRIYVASRNKNLYMRMVEKKNFAGQKMPSIELRNSDIHDAIVKNPSIIPKRVIYKAQYRY